MSVAVRVTPPHINKSQLKINKNIFSWRKKIFVWPLYYHPSSLVDLMCRETLTLYQPQWSADNIIDYLSRIDFCDELPSSILRSNYNLDILYFSIKLLLRVIANIKKNEIYLKFKRRLLYSCFTQRSTCVVGFFFRNYFRNRSEAKRRNSNLIKSISFLIKH